MAPYPEWTLEESRAVAGLQRFVGNERERPAQDEPALQAPQRWGLSADAVAKPGRPSLPVLAALLWWFYDPYTRHQRARLRLSACPVDHGHRTELCQHGPHTARGGWASPAEAMDLVITHLINRARSTSSRLKSQVKPHDSS